MDYEVLRKIKEHPVKFGRMMGFDKLTDLHDEWMRMMLFTRGDATIMAHRGSYKTTCVAGAIALIMMFWPNKRIAFIRKTDGDVKEVIAQVRKMFETNEAKALAQMIWGVPVRLTVSTQGELSTNLTNDPRGSSQLIGMGVNGSLTGKHFDIIFTDDIINLKDRKSRAEREHTKQVYMELQNVKNRGGRIFNTGTPWHVDDASTLMPSPKTWDCYSTGLMSADEIEEVRGHMTASLFAANYELRHIPSDDVIFTRPQTGAHISMVKQGQCHVDAAYYGEDYTAFTAVNKHDGKYYVYGRIWRKHVEDVTPKIAEEVKALLLGKMFMETNADKGYAAQAFRGHGLKVSTYAEHMNKHVKIVTYLKTAWPDIIFCEGTDQAYINQICDYTEDAEHDDAPDSLASLVQRAKFSREYVSPFG